MYSAGTPVLELYMFYFTNDSGMTPLSKIEYFSKRSIYSLFFIFNYYYKFAI